MKKKKNKKRSFWSVSLVSFTVALLMVYCGFSLVISFKEDLEYFSVLLGVSDNFLYFENQVPYEQKIYFGIGFTLIFVLLLILLRTDNAKGYTDEREHGVHGNSRFYEPDEMREKGFAASSKMSKYDSKNPFVALGAKEGIICGLDEDKEKILVIPQDTKLDNRNVLLVGSAGSSKGQAFIIPNILNQKTSSIIVTDPKGELYHLTHEIKRDQGYKVLQIDFMNLVGNAFNPLDYVTDDLEAKRLAYTIARNAAKDDKEDHWFIKAADLLTGLIIYVKEKYPNPSIPIEIKKEFGLIISDENYLLNVVDEIGEHHPAYLYLKEAAVATGNERSGIFSTFTKQTGIFNSQKVKSMTSHSSFHFSELQEQPTILYVKVPIKDNPVAALTATFFDQLIGYLYKYGDANFSRLDIPTIIVFDEFANIGRLNGYDEILQTCRGYLLSLITVVQDFAQLEAKYGKELYRTIINGHATKVFLKTNDIETAKYFETLAGATTVKYNTKSSSSGGGLAYYLDLTQSTGGNVSKSEHYQKKNLLEHHDLMKMDNEKMYAFIDGMPVSLNKAFQNKIFNGLLTSEEKMGNGVSKFNYVYPKHREKYIKTYNLKPYIQEKEISQAAKATPIFYNPAIEEQNNKIEVAEKIENSVLDELISNFIKDKNINLEESRIVENTAVVNEVVEESSQNVQNAPKSAEGEKGITIQEFLVNAKEKASELFGDGSYEMVKQIKMSEEIHDLHVAAEVAASEIEDLNKLRNYFTSTEPKNEKDADSEIYDVEEIDPDELPY